MPGLTVAVTGPTGDLGRAFIRGLERSDEVERIVGMARRPFDPQEHGWERTDWDALGRSMSRGRIGTPEDIAGLSIFLASRAGAFTVGETITCDGGAVVA